MADRKLTLTEAADIKLAVDLDDWLDGPRAAMLAQPEPLRVRIIRWSRCPKCGRIRAAPLAADARCTRTDNKGGACGGKIVVFPPDVQDTLTTAYTLGGLDAILAMIPK